MNKRLLIVIATIAIVAVIATSYALSSMNAEIEQTILDSESYLILTVHEHWFSVTLVNTGNYTLDGSYNGTITIYMDTQESEVYGFTGRLENLTINNSAELYRYDNMTADFEREGISYYSAEVTIAGYQPLTRRLSL